MIVLGDETRHRGLPWVTLGLVGVNLLAFLLQLGLGQSFTRGFACVPKEITTGKDLIQPQDIVVKEAYRERGRPFGKILYRDVTVAVPQAHGPFPIHLTLFTSMFLHGGWMHLIGNMYFLLIFGRNVELAMRHGLFLALYVTCGVVAGLADVVIKPGSVIPYLGASGAISGVMGAYFFLFPLNKIKVWLGWWFGVLDVPAFIFIGLWFIIQYLSTVGAILSGEIYSGTAYWAHVGGFVAGIAFLLVTLAVLKHQQRQIEENGEPEPPEESDPVRDALEKSPPVPDPYETCMPR